MQLKHTPRKTTPIKRCRPDWLPVGYGGHFEVEDDDDEMSDYVICEAGELDFDFEYSTVVEVYATSVAERVKRRLEERVPVVVMYATSIAERVKRRRISS